MAGTDKRRRDTIADHLVDYSNWEDEAELTVRLPAIAPGHPVEIKFEDGEGRSIGTLFFDYDERTTGYRYGGLQGEDFIPEENEVVQFAKRLLDGADAQWIGGETPRLLFWLKSRQLGLDKVWLEDAGSVHVDLKEKVD
jgi:hypothetical protein